MMWKCMDKKNVINEKGERESKYIYHVEPKCFATKCRDDRKHSELWNLKLLCNSKLFPELN